MRDYMTLGSAPSGEDCVQVNRDGNYMVAMQIECKRFARMIRKVHGNEPAGAMLAIKSFPHDFGTYLEVVCHFDDDNEEAVAYANKCEGETPERWS